MRKIDTIIIHATASRDGIHQTVDQIRQMHIKERGFSDIGYHYIIYLDGTINQGRNIESIGAHCTGHNKTSIGIAYVGGTDKDGKPKDTRTPEQKEALKIIVNNLVKEYGIKIVKGHRDFSPDLDGDGNIERFEWIKSCPCFEVSEEFNFD
jgi:N-acetyl-anhydromuramyl-L-alanine amidase AmpD